jgi:GT2 family glycosyltransferase
MNASTHPNVWIVLVNYNGWDDTLLCLQSLEKLTVPASVVLVDNASRLNRLAEIEAKFPWCHLVANRINGGWSGGNNVGIVYARERAADWTILLNNDTRVSPSLVEDLLQTANANPDYGLIGPVINFMSEPEQVMTDGVRFNRPGYDGFFERQVVPLDGRLYETDIVNGCCMMIASKVIDTIGLIDERFFLIHEESDFCLRTREAGFKCGVLGRSLLLHKGSSTFKSTGSRIQRYYDARNLFLLLNKHPRAGRSWLASMKTYLKHLHYRYCSEREHGHDDAANAVLEGVYDTLRRAYGPAPRSPRRGLGLLRGIFDGLRWLAGDSVSPNRVS